MRLFVNYVPLHGTDGREDFWGIRVWCLELRHRLKGLERCTLVEGEAAFRKLTAATSPYIEEVDAHPFAFC